LIKNDILESNIRKLPAGFSMKIVAVLAVALQFINLTGKSQDVDNILWINYAITIPTTKNFSYGGDIGARGLISNQDWNQFLIRPTATYRFNQTIGVAGAVALFSTFNQDIRNLYEFRIHQDLNLKWPDLDVLSFFYRVRIEERFFFYENLPNNFNVRLRYLIGVTSQDFTFISSKRPIYFQVIYEGFKTVADESAYQIFVNQLRIHFAFGHRISSNFRYELHYIKQQSRQYADNGLETTQNIYRVRLFHRLRGREK
jgi:hypothetical protein